jgi:hypothetical protein
MTTEVELKLVQDRSTAPNDAVLSELSENMKSMLGERIIGLVYPSPPIVSVLERYHEMPADDN